MKLMLCNQTWFKHTENPAETPKFPNRPNVSELLHRKCFCNKTSEVLHVDELTCWEVLTWHISHLFPPRANHLLYKSQTGQHIYPMVLLHWRKCTVEIPDSLTDLITGRSECRQTSNRRISHNMTQEGEHSSNDHRDVTHGVFRQGWADGTTSVFRKPHILEPVEKKRKVAKLCVFTTRWPLKQKLWLSPHSFRKILLIEFHSI